MARGRHVAPKKRGRVSTIVTAVVLAMTLAIPAFAEAGDHNRSADNPNENATCFAHDENLGVGDASVQKNNAFGGAVSAAAQAGQIAGAVVLYQSDCERNGG